MQVLVKNFNALTTAELYMVLQLRSEVFVVEQNCIYQDLDGKDQKALHILGYKEDTLVAYTRVFAPGDYFELANIGRVVVKPVERANGLGREIMIASIKAVEQNYKEADISISAQTYLITFYNELGFKETGATYLEDGIPHIKMIKTG